MEMENRMKRVASLVPLLVVSLFGVDARAQAVNVRILSLDEMFLLASKNNQQLKWMASGIDVAEKATDVARGAFLPKVSVSASASYLGDGLIVDRDFGHVETAAMPHFGNRFALEASQVVYAGGAISNAVEKARLGERLARLDYEKDQQSVRFLLASLYLDMWSLRNQRMVYEKTINQEELLVKQMEARLQEGAALKNDVVRHELMLRNMELALIQLDNRRATMNNRIVTMLGISDSTLVEPDTSLLSIVRRNPSSTELLRSADSSLPELEMARVALEIAEKDVGIAKAKYLPSVALFAGDGLEGPITVEIPTIDRNFNAWYVGVGVKYEISSIYDAGRSLRLARSRKAAAGRARNLSMERAALEIRNALIKYRESFDELRVLEKGCEYAEENYGVVDERYANGVALVTEMLDASNSRLDAELKLVNARINTVFQYMNLKRASGSL